MTSEINTLIQNKFEKELFELFRKFNIQIYESFHTPYRQSSYELLSYDENECEYIIKIEIDNSMIARYEKYLECILGDNR